MIVGVLAFQGDFAEHIDVLKSLHVPVLEVRSLEDVSRVSALIIPGGESTVIAKFLEESGVGKEIQKRIKNMKNPLWVFGSCAGAIILARKATGKNAPITLRLIDVVIDRNAYGTQVDSFEAELKISGIRTPVPVAFIRAPKITKIGKNVEVLAKFRGEPVLVRQGRVMISTFHTEVRSSLELHRLFVSNMHL